MHAAGCSSENAGTGGLPCIASRMRLKTAKASEQGVQSCHWHVSDIKYTAFIDICEQNALHYAEDWIAGRDHAGASGRVGKCSCRQLGHFEWAGVPIKRKLAEFRVTEDALLPVGTMLTAAHFSPGQYVDVQGTHLHPHLF